MIIANMRMEKMRISQLKKMMKKIKNRKRRIKLRSKNGTLMRMTQKSKMLSS
jgi:hypothetical protein